MWLLFALVHVFLMAVVNYIDEYLTAKNTVSQTLDKHTKIGGLVLISTLFSFFGASVLWLIYGSAPMGTNATLLSMASAVPMVAMWVIYFYLLLKYPVYQVAPLFLMSSIWLLIFDFLNGGNISVFDVIGIGALLIGAYFLDAGAFRWQIPTRLLLIAIPATFSWAMALYMVRVLSEDSTAGIVTFWQYIGIGLLGVLLFTLVKKYRSGFMYRLRTQGKKFVGLSLLNESVSQSSFLFGNLAIAAAPLAAYVTGMSGVQSLFLIIFFLILPLNEQRIKITRLHIVSILLIVVGVMFIEAFR